MAYLKVFNYIHSPASGDERGISSDADAYVRNKARPAPPRTVDVQNGS